MRVGFIYRTNPNRREITAAPRPAYSRSFSNAALAGHGRDVIPGYLNKKPELGATLVHFDI
jgi:hypothetical protein